MRTLVSKSCDPQLTSLIADVDEMYLRQVEIPLQMAEQDSSETEEEADSTASGD